VSFVKCVVCQVKNRGESFIYSLNKIPPYFSLGASCAHQV